MPSSGQIQQPQLALTESVNIVFLKTTVIGSFLQYYEVVFEFYLFCNQKNGSPFTPVR